MSPTVLQHIKLNIRALSMSLQHMHSHRIKRSIYQLVSCDSSPLGTRWLTFACCRSLAHRKEESRASCHCCAADFSNCISINTSSRWLAEPCGTLLSCFSSASTFPPQLEAKLQTHKSLSCSQSSRPHSQSGRITRSLREFVELVCVDRFLHILGPAY